VAWRKANGAKRLKDPERRTRLKRLSDAELEKKRPCKPSRETSERATPTSSIHHLTTTFSVSDGSLPGHHPQPHRVADPHTAVCVAGQAREAFGCEIIAVAVNAELPTFEIAERLITMQILCALDNITAASAEATNIDTLALRLDRPWLPSSKRGSRGRSRVALHPRTERRCLDSGKV